MKRLILAALLTTMIAGTALADPASYGISCSAGETCQREIWFSAAGVAMDLTGKHYKAQARTGANDINALATFTVYSSALNTGMIRITLPPPTTTALRGKTGVWDLLQTEIDGSLSYIMRGTFKISPSVTRP